MFVVSAFIASSVIKRISLKMRSASFLASLCILMGADIAFAACITSKYVEGFGDRIQCTNVTVPMVLNQASAQISAIMILQSNLKNITQRSFVRFAGTLSSLNIQRCKIVDIHQDALEGLIYLKKLGLSNNNITKVKDGWFKDTMWLEQLDLSFNAIENIDVKAFDKLRHLKRLDISYNRFTCVDPIALQPIGSLEKIHFVGNRLMSLCRGKLTLWLHDHGVDYKSSQSEKENWVDKLLWLCAIDDPDVAGSEILMNECILFNLFNQLRSSLITTESYPLTLSEECMSARKTFIYCIADQARISHTFTNGNVIQRLLLQLRDVKISL